ncbi:MAG: phage tail protein [Desulfosporosinus sp.]
MDKDRMYITLNRNREWKRSLLGNLQPQDNQLVFSKSQEHGMLATGVIITGSIDSTEQDFHWDSIIIEADLSENSVIKVSCFACDSRDVLLGDKLVNLDEYIKEAQKEPSSGIKVLSSLFKQAFIGSTDGLLRVSGRYLWLKLEFLVPQPDLFCLRKIKLLLAGEQIIHYLPEIYRDDNENNDFFRRFMKIFDNIFFDIEENVNHIPEKLDYTLAKGDMLRYLASWVSIHETQNMGDEELRERIATIMPEYSAIGTKPGIERFVERELKVRPRIIEYFEYKQMLYEGRDQELYRELFGTNPYKFFILVPADVFNKQNIYSFMGKLKSIIPAYTEMEIVLLKRRIILGKHTYLGVNSMVSEYSYVSIDENIAISDDTLIGGSIDEE